MVSKCLVSILVLFIFVFLSCDAAVAQVHGHSIDTGERESDGSYRSRDADHYGDAGHNVEFDHEAIIGSVKEAEEFDKLSPEEAKKRLALLLPRMDLNNDMQVNRAELKEWILNSFRKLSKEEAEERMHETDSNKDGLVSFNEYLLDTFGVENEMDMSDEDGDNEMMVKEEKIMWEAADLNGDGNLDAEEFAMFTNPEDHEMMHGYLVNQTFREKDRNGDYLIDFQEFIGERGQQQNKDWLIAEKDKFDVELDENQDGVLNYQEVYKWVIPDNDEIATDEVEHLFASADDDHNDILSYAEILEHHDIFVGSEATDFGNDLQGHFDDEL